MHAHQVLIEPLEELAWLAFEQAPSLCASADGCMAYHRFWPMMRFIDMDGAPPRGRDFFVKAFQQLGSKSAPARVLVAGAADTGLPALIANALRLAGLAATLDLVDRCRTPVELNRRLAEMTGIHLTAHQGRIEAFEGGRFDAAVTHNVMGFNSEEGRQAMLAAIHAALRPGGRLIAVENIRTRRPVKEASAVALERLRLETKLSTMGLSQVRIADLGSAAEQYLKTDLIQGLTPAGAMQRQLDEAGFRILEFRESRTNGRLSPQVHGTKVQPHPHAEIVAERPG